MSTAHKGISNPQNDLCRNDNCCNWPDALNEEGNTDHKPANNDTHSPAKEVGNDSGRDFEQEYG